MTTATEQPEAATNGTEPEPQPEPANVVEALARVMAELPGIGKRTGEQHRLARGQSGGDDERGVKYAYRSIEQITAEASPLLARYGVVFVPRVEVPEPASPDVVELVRALVLSEPSAAADLLSRIVGGPQAVERVFTLGDRGTRWTDSYMAVTYRIYGPGGKEDWIDAGPFLAVGRDNSDKGLNKCQPPGTMVRVPIQDNTGRGRGHAGFRQVPIETLREGDYVVTWDRRRSGLVPLGRRVLGVAARPYDGPLVEVTSGDAVSRYTVDHRCLVRLPDALTEGPEIVYLMRRGEQYRVGRCRWRGPRSEKGRGRIGLAWRAWAEQADGAWVLSVHGSVGEAAMQETLIAVRFGIPQTSFTGYTDSHRGRRASAFSLDEFWQKIGDNRAQASACLAHFGRLIDRPLFSRPGPRTQLGMLPTTETAAANLLSGMLVAVPTDPVVNARGWQTWPVSWVPAEVRRTYYSGLVHSLEVDVDHDYVADGIVTANCMTQAFKQCLLQVLCVADPADEGEHQRHLDEGRTRPAADDPAPQVSTPEELGYVDEDELRSLNDSLADMMRRVAKEYVGPVEAVFDELGYPRGRRLPVAKGHVSAIREALQTALEVQAAEADEGGGEGQPTAEPAPVVVLDEALTAAVGQPVPMALAEEVRAEVKGLTPAKLDARLGELGLTIGGTATEKRNRLGLALVRDRLGTPADPPAAGDGAGESS